MTYKKMQHIPLVSAYLCQDCESIGNYSSFCPACASTALLSLSAILDRPAAILPALPAAIFDERMILPPLTAPSRPIPMPESLVA